MRVELPSKVRGCRHARLGRCARLKCHFAEIERAAFVHELEVIGALCDVSCSLDRHRERASATPNAGPANVGDGPSVIGELNINCGMGLLTNRDVSGREVDLQTRNGIDLPAMPQEERDWPRDASEGEDDPVWNVVRARPGPEVCGTG